MAKAQKKLKKPKVVKKSKKSTASKKTSKSPKKPVKKLKKTVAKKSSSKKTKKVTAVPEGYHSLTPYLIVDDADAAIAFYQGAFGAEVILRIEKEGGKVGHAELQIGSSKIMLADEYPELNIRSAVDIGASPVGIHLYIANVDDVIENALLLGATLVRPIQDMFYGDRSGAIEDPFGHQWYVSTHIEDVTPQEIEKRVAAMEKGSNNC